MERDKLFGLLIIILVISGFQKSSAQFFGSGSNLDTTKMTGLIGYDCTSLDTNITKIALAEIADCDDRTEKVFAMSRKIQLVQENDVAFLSYINCKVTVTRHVQHCGMHSHTSAVTGGYASYIVEVGPSACREIHQRRSFSYGKQLMADLQLNATTSRLVVLAGSVNYDSSCSGEKYSDQFGSWSSVIVTGQIDIQLTSGMTTFDIGNNQIILPDGTRCLRSAGGCFKSSQGEYYWNDVESTVCDEHRYTVLYEGLSNWQSDHQDSLTEDITSVVTVTVEDNEKTFTFIVQRKTSVCYSEAYVTEHPRLFIVMETGGGFTLKKGSLSPFNTDLFLYLNAKFVYIENHFKGQITSLYQEVTSRRCQDRKTTLYTMLSLASISPNDFAFDYMQGPGYTAVLRGEVIYVAKCVPIPVSIRPTTRCYHEIPVTYNQSEFFLTPRTHILTDLATEVECNSLLSPGYHLFGKWYYFTPRPIASHPPHVLSPETPTVWKYETPKYLATAGIYSQSELQDLRKQLIFPYEKPALETVLIDISRGESVDRQGINTGLFFTPDNAQQIAQDVLESMWGWFSAFGQIMSGFIGVIIILKMLHYVVNVLVNGYMLVNAFGFSLRLFAAFSEAIANCLLWRADTKRTRQETQPELLHEAIPEEIPMVPVVHPEQFSPPTPGPSGDSPVAGASPALYPQITPRRSERLGLRKW